MKKVQSVEEYIEENTNYHDALGLLRSTVLSTELEETVKWNFPFYSLNKKNVLSLGTLKNHVCIWFFNVIFLKDEQNLLKNAQEGKTKAIGQMRFDTIKVIDKI